MTTLPPEVLFAKHRLLPEIGPTGQRALCNSTCALPSDLGEGARDAANEYLLRSGVGVTTNAPSQHVREDASKACLAELKGALFALDHVRRVIGVGAPLAISDALTAGTKIR